MTGRSRGACDARLATRTAGLVLLLIVAAPPGGHAHGGTHGLDEQLVENGESLLLGSFTAPQPGALVVVPHQDRPLGCGADRRDAYRIALGNDTGIMFSANATHLQVLFDLPPERTGYLGFATDTHDATRALIMMQENAVARHHLIGVTRTSNETGTHHEAARGVLGIPYPLEPASAHGHGAHGDRTVFLAHDAPAPDAWCSDEAGHVILQVRRDTLPDALSPGMLVHVVVLHDAGHAALLPRALDTTAVHEANLYLARPGEDPDAVRAALDPRPGPGDVVGLLAAAASVAWVVLRVRVRAAWA